MQETCKWVVYAILLATCSPPTRVTTPFAGCEHPSTPGFTVGTGEGIFQEVTDDTEIPYVAGFQGGYHIWGSVRLSSEAVGDGELAFNICQDGVNIARVAFFAQLEANTDDGTLGYTGATVVLLHDLRPDRVADKPTVLAARYIDANGMIFTDTTRFVPRCCSSIVEDAQSAMDSGLP